MEKTHTAAEFFYDDSFKDYEAKRLYRIGDTVTVRADFSPEMIEELRALHGIDAVAALESILVDELIKAAALEKELDAEGYFDLDGE